MSPEIDQTNWFGLTQVTWVDEQDLSYEFNEFVVYKNETGILYWASDSGCSCPSPFEDIHTINDLCNGSKEDCLRALDEWGAGSVEDMATAREDIRNA